MEDIFKIIVEEGKLSDEFKLLSESKLFAPAKALVENIVTSFEDKDGNFIEQFQTEGFNARLWELYLFNIFTEHGFDILDDHNRPDFHLQKEGNELFVEASLSSEKDDEFTKEFIDESIKKNNLSAQKDLIDYYVMRMGSVLYSKLKKKYWELDWVKDKPLIFAITPSHNYISKFLPDAKIMEYLYGFRLVTQVMNGGLKLVRKEVISEHTFRDKKIPANFFSQENTENISAVIFTNNADLHKFNRTGYQQGLSEEELIIIRSGLKYNPAPDSLALEFTYNIEKGKETEEWGESLTIFHNPNAKFPLDRSVFENVRQVWLEKDNTYGGIQKEDFVYNSITCTAAPLVEE